MRKLVGAAGVAAAFGMMLVVALVVPTVAQQSQAAVNGPISCLPSVPGGTLKGGVPVPADVLTLIKAAVPAAGASPLSEALYAAQLYQESQFDPKAQSPVGAQGIAQFMPATWASHGRDENGDGKADPFDPADAVPAGARLDAENAAGLADVGGDPVANMLAAYNAGPGAVRKYGGVPPFAETQHYVVTIRDLASQWSDTPAAGGTAVTGLNAEQLANAQLITKTATTAETQPGPAGGPKRDALPRQAAIVAVTAALTESGLDNGGGTADALGLYRMRPSDGWGTPGQVSDPAFATDAFLDRMVTSVGDWEALPVPTVIKSVLLASTKTEADYQANVPAATAAVGAALGNVNAGVDCTGGTGIGDGSPPSAKVQGALDAAKSVLGVWYVWGGGNAQGATRGAAGGGAPCTPSPSDGGCGYDCSGLAIYAWAQVGVTLPHFSGAQYNMGQKIPVGQAKPGDLIFLSSTGSEAGIHHVAMVYAPGQIIEAQQTGVPVHLRAYRGPAEPEIMPFAVRLAA